MGVRVDKWLWAVRVFKSRAASNTACSEGRVRVGDDVAKPATKVDVGDLVEVRRRDRTVILRVLDPIEKRVGAALVPAAAEDLSPPVPTRDEVAATSAGTRERGAGRPTKRDRRRIDRFRGRE